MANTIKQCAEIRLGRRKLSSYPGGLTELQAREAKLDGTNLDWIKGAETCKTKPDGTPRWEAETGRRAPQEPRRDATTTPGSPAVQTRPRGRLKQWLRQLGCALRTRGLGLWHLGGRTPASGIVGRKANVAFLTLRATRLISLRLHWRWPELPLKQDTGSSQNNKQGRFFRHQVAISWSPLAGTGRSTGYLSAIPGSSSMFC